MRESIKDIAEAVGGKLLCGDPDAVIRHLSVDSRSSEGDDLFIPIIGAKTDAHRFISNAFEAGCIASLTSEHDSMDDPDHAWIQVKDTVEALHRIGVLCRSRIHIPSVGVTGSVGKTTTREMISCALSAGKKVFTTKKNYNSSVGLPLTLSCMTNEDEIAVLELGMNVPGELGMISEIAGPDMAVITNIGVAHIEFYGSQEAICREKFTITKGFRPGKGFLFLNGDDPMLYEHREMTGFPYLTYGTSERCDCRAEEIHTEDGKYCFTYVHNEVRVPVKLSVLGRHNVQNAAAAMAVAEKCGVDLKAAAEKLTEFTGFANRLERIPVHGYMVIDDTYNASPDSMIAGVKVLAAYECTGKRFAVLGEMAELGTQSAEFHRRVGQKIAQEKIDELILVGEMAKQIEEGARKEGALWKITECPDNASAAQYLAEILKAGDTVYLKASNCMHLKEITAKLKEET